MLKLTHCSRRCVDRLARHRVRMYNLDTYKMQKQERARERIQRLRERTRVSRSNSKVILIKKYHSDSTSRHNSELRLWGDFSQSKR